MYQETYIIEYGVYFGTNQFETHTIKVRNCMSEIHAKIKLEGYLKNKYSNFKSMVVYNCTHDFLGILDFIKHL